MAGDTLLKLPVISVRAASWVPEGASFHIATPFLTARPQVIIVHVPRGLSRIAHTELVRYVRNLVKKTWSEVDSGDRDVELDNGEGAEA